jgi:hypothetical protein
MWEGDDPGGEQLPRLTHVIYNAAAGHVRIRAEGGSATTVEVPPGPVRFRRIRGAVEPEAALWLDTIERDYLGRMLEHTLTSLKITPEARAVLQVVQEKLADLAPTPIMASEIAIGETLVSEDSDAGASPQRPAEHSNPDVTPPALSAKPRDIEAAIRPPRAPRRRRPATPRGTSRVSTAPDGAGMPTPVIPPAEPELSTRSPVPADEPAPAMEPEAPLLRGDALSSVPSDVAPPSSFEDVWRDLVALAGSQPKLQPLAGQAASEIREIVEDGVWLYSHAIGREYLVARNRLEAAWGVLLRDGYLVPRDIGMSYGAVTLLAHLAYVAYTTHPVRLYLPSRSPTVAVEERPGPREAAHAEGTAGT